MNLNLEHYSTLPFPPSFDAETPLPQAVPPGFTQRVMVRATDIRKTAHCVTLKEMDARALPVRLRDGVARLLTPYL